MPITRSNCQIQTQPGLLKALEGPNAALGALEEQYTDAKKADATTEDGNASNAGDPRDIRLGSDAFGQIGAPLRGLGTLAGANLTPWMDGISGLLPVLQKWKEHNQALHEQHLQLLDDIGRLGACAHARISPAGAAPAPGNARERNDWNEVSEKPSFPSSSVQSRDSTAEDQTGGHPPPNAVSGMLAGFGAAGETPPIISQARAEMMSGRGPRPAPPTAEEFQQVLDLLQELLDLRAQDNATTRFAAQIDELRGQINDLAAQCRNNRTSP